MFIPVGCFGRADRHHLIQKPFDTTGALRPVYGVPLLARSIFALERAGVSAIWVVTSLDPKRLAPTLAALPNGASSGPSIPVHWSPSVESLPNDVAQDPSQTTVLLTEPLVITPALVKNLTSCAETDAIRVTDSTSLPAALLLFPPRSAELSGVLRDPASPERLVPSQIPLEAQALCRRVHDAEMHKKPSVSSSSNSPRPPTAWSRVT